MEASNVYCNGESIELVGPRKLQEGARFAICIHRDDEPPWAHLHAEPAPPRCAMSREDAERAYR
jgi:hypothetical protein